MEYLLFEDARRYARTLGLKNKRQWLELAKEKVDKYIATIIAEKVWSELGSRDIRDVIKVGRLANDSQQLSYVIDIIKKHRCAQFSRVLLL